MAQPIPSSELIIDGDGRIFHLHLRPDEIADKIILVGDPSRSRKISTYFDTIEHAASNREFVTYTGICRGERLTVMSTGMGLGNIDILMTELDALVNVDFATREVKSDLRQLTLVRLGTCGAVQQELEIGDIISSRSTLSLDPLIQFYEGSDAICNRVLTDSLTEYFADSPYPIKPFAVDMDHSLCEQFSFAKSGVTLSAIGFYGPQGRSVRLRAKDGEMIERLAAWSYGSQRIMNIEMEASAIASLSRLMGHRAATLCTVVAQRSSAKSNPNYAAYIERMVEESLEILTNLK